MDVNATTARDPDEEEGNPADPAAAADPKPRQDHWLTLDLDYDLQPGEEEQFLEDTEKIALQVCIDRDVAPIRESGSPSTIQKAVDRAKREYLADFKDLNVRVSARLLLMAVHERYTTEKTDQLGRTLFLRKIPRRDQGKQKPMKWWGEMRARMRHWPAWLEMSPKEATWLVELWFDDKVQLDPQWATWAGGLDVEMERVAGVLGVRVPE